MERSVQHLQKVSVQHLQKVSSLRSLSLHSIRRMSGRRSQIATGQQCSPTVFPEKRGKIKSSRRIDANVTGDGSEKVKSLEHKIDIGEECSDLLGLEVYSGRLAPYKKSRLDEHTHSGNSKSEGFDAKLTTKALAWGFHIIHLEDVISVSYHSGVRHFTVHAYPIKKRMCGLSCFLKSQRVRQDYRFLAPSSEEAIRWVTGFADQQCFIKCLPHPTVSSKKQTSDVVASEPLFDQPYIKCRSPPKILVILNPRSGHGRSSKVFHGKVEPVFELAGFQVELVKTTSAGHAKTLASTVDLSTCPDGIVCVGGDGIVNEVLNGLLSRLDQKEAISIPIGIIPAGSDNSLVWTVLGVRDPVSAAITIVKGGVTPMDVFAVEWIQTGIIHFGTTVTYFGFVSDVLELSEKYQKRFGPLRYFVAGFLKFLCLPKYSFELEYLPLLKEVSATDGKVSGDPNTLDVSGLYTDAMPKSNTEGIPRASSLSSIDSMMSPNRMSGGDFDTTGGTLASSEPSDYVRGLDPKAKRLSLGRNNVVSEPEEVVHPQPHLSGTPNWPRTRSKSRTDKGWSGLTATNDSRSSWVNDREDISSTISDPGPIWDSEPRWDREPKWDHEQNWEAEDHIDLPGPADDLESGLKEPVPDMEEKWVVKKGQFLGILVCNHSCKTVQSSQIVAPEASHDDNSLDLLLVHGSGRLRLLRFFLRLQCGRHLTLPYVEYVKVKAVKIKPGKITHQGCGIDGELLHVHGQVICSLLPDQCRLIGRPPRICP